MIRFDAASPQDARRALRDGLARSGPPLRFPGAFSPLVARIVEEVGYDGVYVSGGALAADLGMPDVGLTTLSEVADRAHRIATATSLPVIADVDTGFGEALNAARTVQELERLGVAGCHLEDQENPKRCGHLDRKRLVAPDAMERKLRAAAQARRDHDFVLIARTDARASEGLDAAIERARAYVGAGADVVFPEALQDEGEFRAFRAAIDAPLMANMTEFGKSPLLDLGTLHDLGYDLVIYPVTTLRLAMRAVEDGLRAIHEEGTQARLVPEMQTRTRLYELLRYEDHAAFDQAVYDFARDGDD
ncbi:MAG: methylisocitrate lyase [Trueperaceae bacterium]|nr:methylisocitrate lyase [Trueperaceae bacterium]